MKNTAVHVSLVSIVVNVLLTLLKGIIGLWAHSSVLLSDAVHSASDVGSTLVVLLGLRLAGRAPDAGHPYGHERLESVASMLLAVMLAIAGYEIGRASLQSLLSGQAAVLSSPMAMAAAAISIIVKEWMFRYTRRAAKACRSTALMADAWHHRSDALSSVAALIGLVLARLGLPFMEAIASLGVCVFIFKAAWDILADSIDRLVDHACPEETQAAIRESILAVDGVKQIDSLMTRLFGAGMYVDAEIAVDGSLSLREAHDIAERVHKRIEQSFPECRHCMVHVNPAAEEDNGHE